MTRGAWLGAVCIAMLPIVGGCRGEKPPFCSDLSRIDAALAPLRDAKARDDFGRVPDLVNAVGDAYEGIDPPATLRDIWRRRWSSSGWRPTTRTAC